MTNKNTNTAVISNFLRFGRMLVCVFSAFVEAHQKIFVEEVVRYAVNYILTSTYSEKQPVSGFPTVICCTLNNGRD